MEQEQERSGLRCAKCSILIDSGDDFFGASFHRSKLTNENKIVPSESAKNVIMLALCVDCCMNVEMTHYISRNFTLEKVIRELFPVTIPSKLQLV